MRPTRPRAIFVVPAILLVLATGIQARAQGTAAPARPPVVPVTTAPVTRRDVPVIVRALGTVQAFQSVLVRARVDGTLEKVLFAEGQDVKPGDVLAELDSRPYQAALDQAMAKKAADEAMLAAAQSDLVRYSELANSQVASRQKFEQTRAMVLQGQANLRGDEATIATAQLNLGFTKLVAPIQGRVGLRQVDVGNLVRTADPSTTGIVTIAQIQPISVLFTLPQDVLPKVQAAMRRGQLPVTAYSSDDKTKLSEGALLTMDSAIDPSTGTIKLKSVFGNVDNALWPGQFVNIRMQLDTLKDVPTVPSAAIQHGPTGLYTFVVKPDNTVALQPVEVQQDDGRAAVVASGLQGGEAVVVAGQSRLTNGTHVAATAQKPAT